MSDLMPWLLLYAVPGIGAYRYHTLLRRFGTPEAVLNASLSELLTVPGLGPQTAAVIIEQRDYDFAERQIRAAAHHHVKIITIHDDAYPAHLRQIYDPPPLLFIRGRLQDEDDRAIAMVGTRRATAYGREMTKTFCEALAGYGLTIVSGLARGIDTVAHQHALHANGRTVAVLGSGHDRPYPPENRELIERIAQSGAVITEYPFGAGPDAAHFPQRNRIVSGISLGVIVVEAGYTSGAMITAQYALDQNREVFAVPGALTAPASEGANFLIKRGTAKLIQSVEDVVEELGMHPEAKQPDQSSQPVQISLLAEEEPVYRALSEAPQHIDRLATMVNRSTSEVLAVLLNLELKGVIRQLPGKMFVHL